MRETDPTTRRNVLKITGAVGATAFIAGCTDGGGNGENGGNGEEPADGENGENGEEPADGENGENGGNGGDGQAIEPDTRIVLEAQTSGWIGVEPEDIADEENPTLTLQDGESYEIGWEEGDGGTHNIELVDDSDEVVDDYQTDEASEGGDDQFIEFDASDDIAEYVCRPHQDTMRGTIEIEAGENGGNGADEENGENGMDEENGGNGMDEENGGNGMDEENGGNGMDEENGADEEN